MIPWEYLDRAALPTGGEISLYRRGGEFSIRVGHRELMNSRAHASEEALADLAMARIADCTGRRILIGGLGMGFTLAAALRQIGPAGRVVVAELVPEVVTWNQSWLAPLAGYPLRDARVTVHTGDVAQLLRAACQRYDAILLDVDNGPEALTHAGNGWLYARPGLNAALAALRPSGVLAVWSSGPNPVFAQRLRRAGYQVEEIAVPARDGRKGRRHLIWLAIRSS